MRLLLKTKFVHNDKLYGSHFTNPKHKSNYNGYLVNDFYEHLYLVSKYIYFDEDKTLIKKYKTYLICG